MDDRRTQLWTGPPPRSARIPSLVDVAWRDGPGQPWRYGGTGLSRTYPDEEVVEVYEPATGRTHRFVDAAIDRLHVKPPPVTTKGKGLAKPI